MKKKKEFWTGYTSNLPKYPALDTAREIETANAIKTYLGKGRVGRVLEVGCSNGRWLRWFLKNFECTAYGIDSNTTGFTKGGRIKFMKADAFKMPFKDGFFNVVFSLGFFEHYKKSDRAKLLKEQYRILKNGGHLILTVPYTNNLYGILKFLRIKYILDYREGSKHYFVKRGELIKQVGEAGFEMKLNKYCGEGIGTFFMIIAQKLPKEKKVVQ